MEIMSEAWKHVTHGVPLSILISTYLTTVSIKGRFIRVFTEKSLSGDAALT